MLRVSAIILTLAMLPGNASAQVRPAGKTAIPTITEKTKAMQKHEGFLSFYWDAQGEKLWLEVRHWDQEFLHAIATASGVAGRDRGGWGRQRVVRFERAGSKVFLVQSSFSYRAQSADPLEQRAVREAYTDPIVAGFKVAAEEDGRVLIDATSFFMREGARGSVDPARSAFAWEHTASFPRNTEIEVTLTTTGSRGGATGGPGRGPGGPGGPRGRFRGRTLGGATTVRLHHSFVQLPGPGYQPRPSDPRAGGSSISYLDYAAPISKPIRKRFISRHRLIKKDPLAAISAPLKPIIYYVDPGAPEPIRSALVEGASWWNEAFTAIGFKNAFQVKVLPRDADPMDLRYNMILWTHRPQRGWSMGTSVRDPRTGEIICGRVFLGSQRVRQDFLIGSALLAQYGQDQGARQQILDMVLARTRQLAAHEVGHTLGFAHNFAASTRGRASVMDYPHPLIKIRADETFDLADAYDVGIGAWDKVAVAYAYAQFPAGTDEQQALESVLEQAHQRGLFYLGRVGSDSSSPWTHQWDNGPDALVEFDHVMRIRQIALSRFSRTNIARGAQLSSLEQLLVPLYLFHRYQTEAVCKSLGGVDYRLAARGDGQETWQRVAPQVQRKALADLLMTIKPETLALPERILALIPPRAGRAGETFPSHTSPTFDPLAAAETAANLTLSLLLNPQRAARLVIQHALQPDCPALREVIDDLIASTWKASERESPYLAEIGRVVDSVVLNQLLALAANTAASVQVRAICSLELDELAIWAEADRSETDPAQHAHLAFGAARIRQFQKNPTAWEQTRPAETPAGAPIGMGELPVPGMVCSWN